MRMSLLRFVFSLGLSFFFPLLVSSLNRNHFSPVSVLWLASCPSWFLLGFQLLLFHCCACTKVLVSGKRSQEMAQMVP